MTSAPPTLAALLEGFLQHAQDAYDAWRHHAGALTEQSLEAAYLAKERRTWAMERLQAVMRDCQVRSLNDLHALLLRDMQAPVCAPQGGPHEDGQAKEEAARAIIAGPHA